jgi:hypothetical protein
MPETSSQPFSYQSYLLRVWREAPEGPWRASLENATSGEKRAFAQLEDLIDYLRQGLTSPTQAK